MSDLEDDYEESDSEGSYSAENACNCGQCNVNPNDGSKYVYTSDGLTENEYNNSDVAGVGLKRSECCHRYYKENAYKHDTEFKLGIEGMATCIHCFFNLNSYKLKNDCFDMTDVEKTCLEFYINDFTENHNTEECKSRTSFGECILCDAQNKNIPTFMIKPETIAETECVSDLGYIINDVKLVPKTNIPETVLSI